MATAILISTLSGLTEILWLEVLSVSAWTLTWRLSCAQVSALRVDVQRLNHGKRSAEARAVAAESAAQHAQHELAALKMLTASMLAQPQGAAGGPFQELESIESVKPGSTVQASSSVVDTLTQQKGSSCVRPPAVHLCACTAHSPTQAFASDNGSAQCIECLGYYVAFQACY